MAQPGMTMLDQPIHQDLSATAWSTSWLGTPPTIETTDMTNLLRDMLGEYGITSNDFRTFRELFYRKTGIFLADSKQEQVTSRLRKRMEALTIPDFHDYFNRLRHHAGQELQEVINLLTINESFFFREAHQFRCLVQSVLTEWLHLHRKPGDPLRIWSLPSSSGEEPYSIAIHLLEYWPPVDQIQVSIVAADIDTKILARAKAGIYEARSVQNLPPPLLHRYFSPVGDNQHQICQELRDSIEFRQLNLMDREQTRSIRGVDVIFCRNLLIYFDQTSRRQAADTLFDALKPGGFLFLGHAESMSRISSLFQVRHFPEAIVYQRPY